MQAINAREVLEVTTAPSTRAGSFPPTCLEMFHQFTSKNSTCCWSPWEYGAHLGLVSQLNSSATTQQLLKCASTRSPGTPWWPSSWGSTCYWWWPSSLTQWWRRSPPLTTGLQISYPESSAPRLTQLSSLNIKCPPWPKLTSLINSFLSPPPGEVSNVLYLLSGLAQLKEDNWRTQSYYYAKNTSRNVLSHIRQWIFFTVFFGLCPLPASTENLVLFTELMAVTVGYDHIKAVIGSIGFLHEIFNLPFQRDSFQLRLTLQSLKRRLARAPFQALSISIIQLKEMYKYVDIDKPEDLAICCSSTDPHCWQFRHL